MVPASPDGRTTFLLATPSVDKKEEVVLFLCLFLFLLLSFYWFYQCCTIWYSWLPLIMTRDMSSPLPLRILHSPASRSLSITSASLDNPGELSNISDTAAILEAQIVNQTISSYQQHAKNFNILLPIKSCMSMTCQVVQ